ncbi:protein phosphatase 2C domain-containing protein [Cereibacter sphaeroides]|uniref:PP2C family protein-serine/threonine phosphatase n=1 Tax=Cereibacter sphaeroides TaxID=1063 RepID=UPI001F393BF5|nr:protein phosphatase 2C domain-containing protein [Cereibacter sphaeroides]MCE6960159.1 protein phosphatase 2C domain-containing protein [Cereibacter sphaeroides]MCE6967941.1 protein phosphatase 2C domain-containing protein [Cereibacter sphaeroides]MCE6974770.1 protein phosphatase 2C domain-containing protein [Cereibacter sphaeroides]
MTFVHGQQIIGRRETQEDSLDIIFQNEKDPRSDVLMLLADGMGGHAGGEVASGLALRAFAHHFTQVARAPRPADRLQDALEAANEAIRAALSRDPSLRGMGCTLIAAIKLADRLVWVSVGDSAIYLLRRGVLRRVNADHSIFGELMGLVEAGRMTRAEAAGHPRRNVLRSALTGNPLTLVDVNSLALEPGDAVVIATDGLDALPEAELVEILNDRMRGGARAVTEALLAAVERKGHPSQDNTSVIVYRHPGTRAGRPGALNLSAWRLPLAAAGVGSALVLAGLAIYAALGGPAAQPEPAAEAAGTTSRTEMRDIPVPAEDQPVTPKPADPPGSVKPKTVAPPASVTPRARPPAAAAPQPAPAPARVPEPEKAAPDRT